MRTLFVSFNLLAHQRTGCLSKLPIRGPGILADPWAHYNQPGRRMSS